MIVFDENRKTAGSFQNCTVIFGIWQQLRPFEKKTYGHKYYVAASIGFEEKSYPYLRKIK